MTIKYKNHTVCGLDIVIRTLQELNEEVKADNDHFDRMELAREERQRDRFADAMMDSGHKYSDFN